MRYLITISYDGSKYMGLQKLKSGNTVQGELEKVLSKLNESSVKVACAGRTDRGVHAIDQKCMFDLQKKVTPFRLRYYINRSTTPYLYVKSCEVLENMDFHPRFSVKSKTYRYKINTGEYNPLKEDYEYNYNKSLDVNKMIDASKLFLGPHNYRAFVVGKQKTCDSIIDEIKIESIEEKIEIIVRGKAFYTYMVRNIVASLVLIGNGTLEMDDIKVMLETGKKVIEYAPAPPNGLYLEKIEY